MYYYLFTVLEGSPIELANEELEKKGLKDIYVIEDDSLGEICLGGHSRKKIAVEKLVHSILSEEKDVSAVDWHEQWELFAEDFREGRAHIDLSRFGKPKTLLLMPGAGFGDLSHPTTYLMLEMMQGRVEGNRVVDIGTGSGILALAALMLGSTSAIGIDIDEEALVHAQKNAAINGLEEQAQFSKKLPRQIGEENIFLMNMIFPEQKEFKPEKLNRHAKIWIVSGILEEQEQEYLAQTVKWGWRPVSRHSKAEWLGWIFKT